MNEVNNKSATTPLGAKFKLIVYIPISEAKVGFIVRVL